MTNFNKITSPTFLDLEIQGHVAMAKCENLEISLAFEGGQKTVFETSLFLVTVQGGSKNPGPWLSKDGPLFVWGRG